MLRFVHAVPLFILCACGDTSIDAGYFGPCSGGRGNTYVWTVHALPVAALPVDRVTTERIVASTVEAMALSSASFMGTY